MWWYREGNKEQGWRRVGVLSKHCSHTCVISGFWMSNWMSNLSSDLIVFNNMNSQDLALPKLRGSHHLPPYSIFYASHGACTQMSFCFGTPKFGVLKFLKLEPHDFGEYVAHHLHTSTSGWLLVVDSQIDNLTFDPSFGHNLCFKYPNGSCEPILDIYVSRAFYWYKELFNPMGFDPCNRPLNIWKSIKTPAPKVGAHLGMCGFNLSHSPTLPGAQNVTFKLHSWPTPLQALALVVSPRLGLWHCTIFVLL
jgi:hypothetical protein